MLVLGAYSQLFFSRWHELKGENPSKVVGVLMGSFVEFFFEDAEDVSSALGIALTIRGRHLGVEVPMCGVPITSVAGCTARLADAGHSVVIVPVRVKSTGDADAIDPNTAPVGTDAARRQRRGKELRCRIERLIGPHTLATVQSSGPSGADIPALERLAVLAELATMPIPVDPFSISTMLQIGAEIGAAFERYNVHDSAKLGDLTTEQDDEATAAMAREMHRVEVLQSQAMRLPVRSSLEAIVAAGIIRDHLSEVDAVGVGEPVSEHHANLSARAAEMFDSLVVYLLTSTGIAPSDAGMECYLSSLAKRAGQTPGQAARTEGAAA